MKFLITGANGFLGKYFFKELVKSSDVFKLGRKNADYNYDLSIEVPIFNHEFDCVIHAAGLAHKTSGYIPDYEEFISVNINGTKNLLFGLENFKAPKSFFFISSVSVYGLNSGKLISEQTELNANDPYGKSKVAAEDFVIKWCEEHNVICTILRLPLIVGADAPGNLGAMIAGIRNGYYFNVGGGKAHKSMVLAEDVAKAILRVMDIGGIYNLTDGYHPTFDELSNHISKQLGKRKPTNLPLWFVKIASRLGDILGNSTPLNTKKLIKITSDLTFDDKKARESFGWNPTQVLDGFKVY